MERRGESRRAPATEEPLSRARLRTGRELAVLDVSDHGALVEGGRLLPGTHIDIHLVTRGGRVLVRGRVVRASVYSLSSHAVVYRSALAFERPVDTGAVQDAGWLTTAGYGVPDALQPPAA